MEISREVRLTADEVTEIIKKHLQAQGHTVDKVYFDIHGENMPGDHFSEQPLIYMLKGARCR